MCGRVLRIYCVHSYQFDHQPVCKAFLSYENYMEAEKEIVHLKIDPTVEEGNRSFSPPYPTDILGSDYLHQQQKRKAQAEPNLGQ